MANNDPNNDEYKLDDLDLLASEPEEELEPEELGGDSAEKNTSNTSDTFQLWENPAIRKALVIFGGFILFLLVYKTLHFLFGGKSTENKIVPVAQQTQKPTPLQQPMSINMKADRVTEKLAVLEQNQQSAQSSLQNLNDQISSMNTAMSDMTSKMNALSASLASVSQQLETQTQEIERLVAMNTKRIRPIHVSKPRGFRESVMYSLQAIIPGRAWLIASDGTSITVREGSTVAGYGIVKGIDAERGRVLMSSGRVIKFSQVDS